MRVVIEDALSEVLHSRLAVAVIVLAVVHALLAPAVGSASLGDGARAIASVGIWLCTLAALVGSVSIGISAIGGAVADGSAQMVLMRPITRRTWVVGRALGAALGIAAWCAAVVLSWLPVAAWWGLVQPALFAVLAALILEMWLIGAWALLLGSLARPTIAAIASSALVFAGVFADEVLLYAGERGPLPEVTARALYTVLPDLDLFDVHVSMVTDSPIEWSVLGFGAAYAVSTAALLVGLAAQALTHRDLA
ncbi:MAG: hypothetical protein KC912_10850 [Proteobacteria bacterium]|nr:hypothetical protein [Pseudomonadota bacterium]